jgi:hypothetical protein
VWWSLPFTESDEEAMRKLGYRDPWIRWMKAAHDQNMRTLVTHEIAEQAAHAVRKDLGSTNRAFFEDRS